MSQFIELKDIEMIIRRSKKEQSKKIPQEITIKNNSLMVMKMLENFNKPVSTIKDLLDDKEVAEYLKDKSVSTKKNYYLILRDIAIYDKIVNGSDNDKVIDEFYKKVGALDQSKKTDEAKGKMSEKKTIKMELTDADIETLLKLLKENGLHKEFVIFSILNQYPYRAEIATLKLISLKEYNQLKKTNTLGKTNYLINGTRKMSISRGDYKTAETYGRIETEMTGNAKKVLKEYIKSNNITDGQSLFGLTNDELVKRLSYITNKYLKVSLSVNSLAKLTIRRNIIALHKTEQYKSAVETEKTRMDKAVMEQLAQIRGTSTEILYNSYLRD